MRLYLIAGAALALIAGLTFSHIKAYQAGAQGERAAALSRSIDLIKERGKTNAEVNRLDDAALCRELGGKWVPDTASCE